MKRAVALGTLLLIAGCQSREDRLADKQKSLEEQRKQMKDDQAKKDNPTKSDDGPKDPFWDNPSNVLVQDEGKCPDNFWALFNMPAPGADAAEKKANEAKRAEYAKQLKDSTFVIKYRLGTGLDLGEYNPPKGSYPLKVKSTIDCKDSYGNVTIALSEAKAQTPPSSAAKEGAAYTMRIWYAEPMDHELKMDSMGQAKEWKNKYSLGLEGKFLWKPGKAQIDKKLEKVEKHVEKAAGETISIGGGTEDWGAGRVVQADVQAMRITQERGTKTLIEKR